ncbi:MAG: 2,3-bisphosphoglycerate-independent phosphoglycerate mutase [Chloroflexi bacterium]|nr:2,3-bisphosphoglycerate-independent phosphoglycerate mutase [Chloroflexota bacterium]
MLTLDQIKELAVRTPSKIVLLVLDGLGGLPPAEGSKTELATARTPNMDRLAHLGSCGLSEPVSPGITPGSAPSHMALFGYDPIKYEVGRGVLEALGIDFDLQDGDVAARGNFCSVDRNGVITDRRAGRISTEECSVLCQELQKIKIPGVQVFVLPVKEHRFALIMRGAALRAELADTDPQREGMAPLPIVPLDRKAERTARLVKQFVSAARDVLKDEKKANMVLLRGFSLRPALPPFEEVFKLRAAAIASYPMYRGLAKLVGMEVLTTGSTLTDELATLEANFGKFDFFYVHVKGADSAGEDGDFARKVKVIEEVDAALPRISTLGPDVLIVTGDHSTPAVMKSHSWHPVPFVIRSKSCRPDRLDKFSEDHCLRGHLGNFPALAVMPVALAHALKLNKYGA